jgi:hypothetical protein
MVLGDATPYGGQGLHEERQVPRKEHVMYATVRRYEGVTDPQEAGRRVKEGFVPLISQIPGFVAYYWIDAGGGVMVSTSVFEDQAGEEESNRRAADWVREHLAPVLPNRPQITAGEVVATK